MNKKTQIFGVAASHYFLIEFGAGIIFALGLFKPLILIWLPLIFYRAHQKWLLFLGMMITSLLLDAHFFRYPSAILEFWHNIASGKTITIPEKYYRVSWLNYLWRMPYSGFRHQICLFPCSFH